MWPQIVAALISAYAGNRAAKKARKKSSTEKQLEQQLLSNTQQQNAYGKELINLSRDPIMSSTRFLNAAANGNREQLMEILGPELANISDGARQSIQTMAQLTPRSGLSAESMSRVPFQTALAQGKLMSDTRRDARTDLMSMGTNLASMGGSFLNSGSGGANNLLEIGRNRRNDSLNIGSSTSEGMMNLISGLMKAYTSGRGVGGGGGVNQLTNGAGGMIPASHSFFGGGGRQAIPDYTRILGG